MPAFYEIEISQDKGRVQSWALDRLVYPPFPDRKRWQIEYREKCFLQVKIPHFCKYFYPGTSREFFHNNLHHPG